MEVEFQYFFIFVLPVLVKSPIPILWFLFAENEGQ